MNPNLNVITLTKSELLNSLRSNTYWGNKRILMPKSKACWLLKNERIESENFCSIVCLEDNNIISYILTIPDTIQLNDGSLEKVNWLHEWLVDNKYQGSIISSYVFNKTIKKLNNNVLIESNGENAEAFFNSQFKTIYTKTRHTIFFILKSEIVASKFPFLKYLKFLIDAINKTLVKLLNILSANKAKKRLAKVSYEYLNELDTAAWEFIEPRCNNDFALKTKNYINWHNDNSQYIQTPIAKKINFVFSTTGFSNIFEEILQHDNFNLTNKSTTKDVDGWESATHMMMITEIENNLTLNLNYRNYGA